MQSLAKRHEDRAARKAMNRTETSGNTALSIGTIALAYRSFAELRYGLNGDKSLEAELGAAMDGIDAEFAAGEQRSLAEAPDGSGDTMAGIGVINPDVVPAKFDKVKALPEPQGLDAGSNINGQALVDQAGGAGAWGSVGTPKSGTDSLSGNGGGTGDDGQQANK